MTSIAVTSNERILSPYENKNKRETPDSDRFNQILNDVKTKKEAQNLIKKALTPNSKNKPTSRNAPTSGSKDNADTFDKSFDSNLKRVTEEHPEWLKDAPMRGAYETPKDYQLAFAEFYAEKLEPLSIEERNRVSREFGSFFVSKLGNLLIDSGSTSVLNSPKLVKMGYIILAGLDTFNLTYSVFNPDTSGASPLNNFASLGATLEEMGIAPNGTGFALSKGVDIYEFFTAETMSGAKTAYHEWAGEIGKFLFNGGTKEDLNKFLTKKLQEKYAGGNVSMEQISETVNAMIAVGDAAGLFDKNSKEIKTVVELTNAVKGVVDFVQGIELMTYGAANVGDIALTQVVWDKLSPSMKQALSLKGYSNPAGGAASQVIPAELVGDLGLASALSGAAMLLGAIGALIGGKVGAYLGIAGNVAGIAAAVIEGIALGMTVALAATVVFAVVAIVLAIVGLTKKPPEWIPFLSGVDGDGNGAPDDLVHVGGRDDQFLYTVNDIYSTDKIGQTAHFSMWEKPDENGLYTLSTIRAPTQQYNEENNGSLINSAPSLEHSFTEVGSNTTKLTESQRNQFLSTFSHERKISKFSGNNDAYFTGSLTYTKGTDFSRMSLFNTFSTLPKNAAASFRQTNGQEGVTTYDQLDAENIAKGFKRERITFTGGEHKGPTADGSTLLIYKDGTGKIITAYAIDKDGNAGRYTTAGRTLDAITSGDEQTSNDFFNTSDKDHITLSNNRIDGKAAFHDLGGLHVYKYDSSVDNTSSPPALPHKALNANAITNLLLIGSEALVFGDDELYAFRQSNTNKELPSAVALSADEYSLYINGNDAASSYTNELLNPNLKGDVKENAVGLNELARKVDLNGDGIQDYVLTLADKSKLVFLMGENGAVSTAYAVDKHGRLSHDAISTKILRDISEGGNSTSKYARLLNVRLSGSAQYGMENGVEHYRTINTPDSEQAFDNTIKLKNISRNDGVITINEDKSFSLEYAGYQGYTLNVSAKGEPTTAIGDLDGDGNKETMTYDKSSDMWTVELSSHPGFKVRSRQIAGLSTLVQDLLKNGKPGKEENTFVLTRNLDNYGGNNDEIIFSSDGSVKLNTDFGPSIESTNSDDATAKVYEIPLLQWIASKPERMTKYGTDLYKAFVARSVAYTRLKEAEQNPLTTPEELQLRQSDYYIDKNFETIGAETVAKYDPVTKDQKTALTNYIQKNMGKDPVIAPADPVLKDVGPAKVQVDAHINKKPTNNDLYTQENFDLIIEDYIRQAEDPGRLEKMLGFNVDISRVLSGLRALRNPGQPSPQEIKDIAYTLEIIKHIKLDNPEATALEIGRNKEAMVSLSNNIRDAAFGFRNVSVSDKNIVEQNQQHEAKILVIDMKLLKMAPNWDNNTLSEKELIALGVHSQNTIDPHKPWDKGSKTGITEEAYNNYRAFLEEERNKLLAR